MVPKKLLKEQQSNVKKVQKECEEIERQLLEERVRCRRLQDALLNKIEALASQSPGIPLPDKENADSSAALPATLPDVSTVSKKAGFPRNTVSSAPAAATASQQTAEDSSKAALVSIQAALCISRNLPAPPDGVLPHTSGSTEVQEGMMITDASLFETQNGKVNFGAGLFIDEAEFLRIRKARTDSIFCRELIRAFWKPSELFGRSATGQPPRRFAKEGRPAKPCLTPQKLEAVKNAFHKYVEDTTEKGLPDAEKKAKVQRRTSQFRKHLCYMLNDLNKKKQ
ncbi:uncharacterized protein LOC135400760 isoform X2 [Ornithodoros turicata]